MTRLRRTLARAAAVAAAVALVVVPAVSASAASYVAIAGTGSTWSQNALDQWRKNVANNYGMTVNYSGTGSSAGRNDFIKGTVDFAVSEIPFQSAPEDGSAPERPDRGYAYMPIVAGGTSFMYNLKINGKRVTNLRLSGEVVAKIFTGQITKWNDPAVQGDNPGLKMPDRAITPVVRSDGSGSTAQFTLWMSKQHPGVWTRGMTSQYPLLTSAFKGQSGSLGVAGYVSQNYGEGAITYVEYSYAMKSGFPVAKVLNQAGFYVEPTAFSVAVALTRARINSDLTQILDDVYAATDPRTYPLSSYSYMIVPTEVKGIFTPEKGNTLGAFAKYLLCEGQQQAGALGYSPLPMNLVSAGFDQVRRIPGADVGDLNLAACNNPTAGDRLTREAPQPAACDKQGPNQCVTGTAGSVGTDTEVSGSGDGGSAAGGPGATGDAPGAGGAQAASEAAAAATYDADGNLISGSAGSVVAGTAKSAAFELPAPGWGPAQIGMTVAAILLILGVAIPPVLLRSVGRRSSR